MESFVTGVDEAGRGAVIGPLVVAGVTVRKQDEKKLKQMGCKDSKVLSPKKREELAEKIEKVASKVIVMRIQPCTIDDYRRSGVNLDRIEAMKMAQIIGMCNDGVKNMTFVDALSQNPKRFEQTIVGYLQDKSANLVVKNHMDESVPVVSAASIIAKVERDKVIKEIKKKMNFDFASLPYKEEVLIEISGKRRLMKIGEIVRNYKNYRKLFVFSMNPKTFRIHKYQVTNVITHPKTGILELNLEHGSSIRLTNNHPLLTVSSNGVAYFERISKLKKGDFVALASRVPPGHSQKWINLTEVLNIPKSKDHVSIGKTRLPNKLKLEKEFLEFLGLYVAEGYIHDDYHVGISATTRTNRRKILGFGEKFGIKCTRYDDAIVLNSKLLVMLVKSLGLGTNAYKKAFPEFAFSLESIALTKLLSSYFIGDGYLTKNLHISAETYSRRLATQLRWLLLHINQPTSLSKRNTRKGEVIRVLSKGSNSLSVDNMPTPHTLLRMSRIENKLTLSQLSRATGIKKEILHRIELGKTRTIRKRTLSKIISAYRTKNKAVRNLQKLMDSDLIWCRIKKIRKLGRKEPVYDLEVNPQNKRIENFLAGDCGIIVHNSGYPHDPKTIEFVEGLVKNKKDIPTFVRRSWITTQNLVEKNWQRKIKDFFKRKEPCKEGAR